MTQPSKRGKEIVEKLGKKLFKYKKGEIEIEDVKDWLTTTLTQLEAEKEQAVEEERDDLLDDMWGLICNVNGGVVEDEKPEWYEAFKRIRKKYFTTMDNHLNHE